MRRVLGIVVVVVGLMVFAFMRRGDVSEDTLTEMRTVIAQLDIYPAHQAYLDGILDEAHKHAFFHNFETGSRSRRDTFDRDKYEFEVLNRMAAICQRDKKDDLAAPLIRLRESVSSDRPPTDAPPS